MFGLGIGASHVELKLPAGLDGGSGVFIIKIEIKIRVARSCGGTAESQGRERKREPEKPRIETVHLFLVSF
jgi:hypothetical protein